MNLKIRKAKLRDSEKLIRLADELIHSEDIKARNAMLTKSLKDLCNKIFVVEVNGILAGFVEIRIFPDFIEAALIAVIQNLIVSKDYRRSGVGSKLVEKAVGEAKNKGASEIHVWTEFNNEGAIKFYSRHGFTKRVLLLEKELMKASVKNPAKDTFSILRDD